MSAPGKCRYIADIEYMSGDSGRLVVLVALAPIVTSMDKFERAAFSMARRLTDWTSC